MARKTRTILGTRGQLPLPGPRPNDTLPSSFWTEAERIFGKMLSPESRLQIERETNHYTFAMEHSLSAASIAKACSRLVKAMVQFRQAFNAVINEPETGAHIRQMITDDSSRGVIEQPNWLDDQWWAQFEGVKERLSDEEEECKQPNDRVSWDNRPWETWVRRLAEALKMEGFAVNVLNYESRADRRKPTPFVQFVAQLQAELPEWLEQHQPENAAHRWLALNKAIQRALRSPKANT
jgi:hypothetical protein